MKHDLPLMFGLRAEIEPFASADALPKRFKILNWGENKTASGRPARVGELTLSALAANQHANGFDEVALDFVHNTVPGTRAYKESAEPRPVAAYGTLEVLRGDGVFFNVSRWTPEGEKSARNFQDLSPAPSVNSTGEVVFVHSAGLCRNGDIYDMVIPFSVPTPTQDNQMDYKAELLKLLGLPTDAADDAINAALVSRNGKPVEAMSAKDVVTVTALSADVQALKDADAKRERAAIVDQATRAGKVIPLTAEQIAATPIETLSAMVGKLPVTVPLHRRTPDVEPMEARTPAQVIEAYNAIENPTERAAFWRKNEAVLSKSK